MRVPVSRLRLGEAIILNYEISRFGVRPIDELVSSIQKRGPMQRILKFPVTPHFTINVPSGSRILSVQICRGQPQMWVLVDPALTNIERSFRAYTTGEEIHGGFGEYVATYQTDDGGYVYHLFETT